MSLTTTQKDRNFWIYFVGFVVAFICLFLKTHGHYFPGEYLWAEDGPIFIQQAFVSGWHAFFIPHSGYLHSYLRLVAFFGNFLSLPAESYLFIVDWMICFIAFVIVLIRQSLRLQIPIYFIYCLLIITILQPIGGEIFFNLTNSQWLLWSALAIHLLTRESHKPSLLELFILIIGGLSGPFCILILPILFIKVLIEKNFSSVWPIFFVLSLSAVIQISYVIHSNRFSNDDANNMSNIVDWVKLIIIWCTFMEETLKQYILAFVFWVFLSLTLLFNIRNRNIPKSHLLSASYLLAFAFICLLSGISVSVSTHILADRYVWIPYSLFFFAVTLLLAHSKRYIIFSFFMLTLLCILPMREVGLANFQFSSFANFAKYVNINIPINPPGWSFNKYAPTSQTLSPHKLDLFNFASTGANTETTLNKVVVKTTTQNASLTFNTPIDCGMAKDIGLLLTMQQKDLHSLQLQWSENKKFSRKQVLPFSFTTSEITTIPFAFPYHHQPTTIRLMLPDSGATIKIKNIDFYCLP